MENALSNGILRKHLNILKEHGEAFLSEYEELCKKHSILIDSFVGDPEIQVVDKNNEISYNVEVLKKSLKRTIALCKENLECGGKTPLEMTLY